MKKRALLILVLIISFLIMAILLISYFNYVKIICSLKNSLESKDVCFSSYARNTDKIDYCDLIINNNKKANCYKGVALRLQEEYICNSIENQDALRDSCIVELAVIKKDVSICLSLPSQGLDDDLDTSIRDRCKVLVAIENKDISICDDLDSEGYVSKEQCLNLVAN